MAVKLLKEGNNFSPARILVLGFAVIILLGSILLSMPFATVEGEIAYIDALFTATSAVCVTGLVVVDTGTFFTPYGQLIIMALIFAGALGFMTSATLVFVVLGRRITLRDRLVIKEALHTEGIQGAVALVLTVVRLAVLMVLAGTVLLSLRFVPEMGWDPGLFFSLFHAVSAFANAGFDLTGNFESLTGYADDYLVSGTILGLFIIGGLGFTVLLDLYRPKRFFRFSLHTKLVLVITAALLVVGTLLVWSVEGGNPQTLGDQSAGNSLFRAFFTSATARTAGFSVAPTELFATPTLFLLLFLMFIGASPASTGGGIKTTTFGLIVLAARATIMGREEVEVFERRVPTSFILKALTIIIVSLLLIFLMIFAMTIIEEKPFLPLVFEVFSAFGTVGLSTGITPELGSTARALIIVTMFFGRVGPLTMLYALHRRLKPGRVRYPEERVMIG